MTELDAPARKIEWMLGGGALAGRSLRLGPHEAEERNLAERRPHTDLTHEEHP